jgi:restriction system protein
MITEKSPESWQQLQEWTAQILRECGWKAQTEVRVKTARGTAEIDVFAIETVRGREYKTLIECKNWTARVPQNVVHAFRAVMAADIGANTGYIISRAGFQAGAYEAAANTNVKLLSWGEFQEVFEDQWYWTHLTQQAHEVLDPLCSYLEPLPAMIHWDSYLHEGEIARLKEMCHQHFPLGALIMLLQPFMAGRNARIPLPIGDRAKDYGDLPASVTSRTGYREFFDELVKHALPILAEFQSFRDLAFERKKAAEHS